MKVKIAFSSLKIAILPFENARSKGKIAFSKTKIAFLKSKIATLKALIEL